ncbi:hypothetical protein [Vagococcus carniphilus]|uniref:hypothetical protein n=1 Tax=Vagococcus carniphilus TaxID=218144 RepID=UPI003B5AF2CE
MGKKNFLVLVEGAKAEPKLLQSILSIYDMSNEYNIFSYETNLYSFYNRLKNNDYLDIDGSIPDDLDLPLVIHDLKNTPESLEIRDEKFTDILLIFDFDPHDTNYSADILHHFLTAFDDSSDGGKLYLNYPMVESFWHLPSPELSQDDFNDLSIDLECLKNKEYKELVHCNGCRSNSEAPESIKELMKKHYQKFNHLNDISEYTEFNLQSNVLNHIVDEMNSTETIKVINTSVIFIYDYNFNLV